MTNYLETNYFVEEYGENDYPQILCNYIAEKYLKPHFKEIKGLEMLDLGSGKGNQLLAFDRLGLKVTGLDKRAECLDILESFTIKECDLENESLPFKNNSFDFIFSKSVIEHVENSDNFLSEIYRVLKKEGLLVLMTPDWDSQHSTFYDDYTHVKPWTRKGLQNALRMHEFLDVNCIYFKQLPIL